MVTLSIHSEKREALIDITSQIVEVVSKSSITDGICVIYTPHTTAGITINENADPDVKSDIIKGLLTFGLESVPFQHGEGNSPAHIKSSLIGCSETVIISQGRPVLGTWQGIYFCEFDGPRKRKVHVQLLPS